MKIKSFIHNNGPGVITAVVLAGVAIMLSAYIPFAGSATLALLLGLALGNINLGSSRINAGLAFTERKVLEAAIVLIGFGLNARIFSQMGWSTWLFVGLSVLAVLGIALLAGKALGLSARLSVLLGAGSAICGSAAIGAVSPLIRSEEAETGLSIGIINLLGTVGLLLLPAVSVMMAFSDESSSLLIGGVLQSMGHVVGAGFSMGDNIGTLATVVKMGRILLIIPLMIALYFVGRGQVNKSTGRPTAFPVFIPLFILSLLLAQIPAFPQSVSANLASIGDYLLIAAMVGIGFKIRIRPLFKMAGPALLAGLLIFTFQIALFVAYLYF